MISFFDVEGRMWVETTYVGGDRWEVFDRDGALQFSLPVFPRSRATAPYLGDWRIAYVMEDSVGIQRVQVTEIDPAR